MNLLFLDWGVASSIAILGTTLFTFAYKYLFQPLWDKHKEATDKMDKITEMCTKVSTQMDLHANGSNTFRTEILNKVDNLNYQIGKLSEEQIALESRIIKIEDKIK